MMVVTDSDILDVGFDNCSHIHDDLRPANFDIIILMEYEHITDLTSVFSVAVLLFVQAVFGCESHSKAFPDLNIKFGSSNIGPLSDSV
jgi:hypothetical protein